MRKLLAISALIGLSWAGTVRCEASEMPKCERTAAAALQTAFPSTKERLQTIDCALRNTGSLERVKVCRMTMNTGEAFVVVLSESCDKSVVVYEDS